MKPFALLTLVVFTLQFASGCSTENSAPTAESPKPAGVNGLSPDELKAIEAAQAAASQ
jgi:hypothetical protein